MAHSKIPEGLCGWRFGFSVERFSTFLHDRVDVRHVGIFPSDLQECQDMMIGHHGPLVFQ